MGPPRRFPSPTLCGAPPSLCQVCLNHATVVVGDGDNGAVVDDKVIGWRRWQRCDG